MHRIFCSKEILLLNILTCNDYNQALELATLISTPYGNVVLYIQRTPIILKVRDFRLPTELFLASYYDVQRKYFLHLIVLPDTEIKQTNFCTNTTESFLTTTISTTFLPFHPIAKRS
jgi:hypothetical protein